MKTFCWITSVVKGMFWQPLLYAVALCFSLSASAADISHLEGKTMGTYWSVKIAQELKPQQLQALQAAIEKRLAEVNQSMSTYIPDSELSQWNKNPSTEALPISAELQHVVAQALQICRESDGIYDISVQPLVNAWGFGPKKVERAPTEEEIQALLADVGCQKLHLGELSLRKERPNMMVDLSSIAKGYGVDEVAQTLEALQYRDYLVDIGGEMRVGGQKYDKAWTIGIETPQAQRQRAQLALRLKNGAQALATSGNYRNFIDFDGLRAVHTLNPKTGQPQSSRLLSATVIAENAMLADAYATALMALGEQEALPFAEKQGLAVILIFADEQQQWRVAHSSQLAHKAEIME